MFHSLIVFCFIPLLICVTGNFGVQGNASKEATPTTDPKEVRDGGTIADVDSRKFPNHTDTCKLPPPDPGDAHLSAAQLIRKKGYPFEAHTYMTEDGYFLTAHRIPRPGAHPIVLMHGIMCSSRDWLMQRGDDALAYMLYNSGYDVWLANMRGNTYSQRHRLFPTNDPRFWDFTVDDISYQDVPATIDYVLAATSRSQVAWIGYSLGTTVLLSSLIANPEYQSKISCHGGLAPVAFKGHVKSKMIQMLSHFAIPEEPLKGILGLISKNGEFVSEMINAAALKLNPIFCNEHVDKFNKCGGLEGIVGGFNKDQVDQAMQPVILGGFPSLTSIKVVLQQFQHTAILAGSFRNYFYQNLTKNLELYGNLMPPELNLTTFNVPSVFISGINDALAPPEDVGMLLNLLPRTIFAQNVSDPTWNHLDFVFGKDARVMVYDVLIPQMRACAPP